MISPIVVTPSIESTAKEGIFTIGDAIVKDFATKLNPPDSVTVIIDAKGPDVVA